MRYLPLVLLILLAGAAPAGVRAQTDGAETVAAIRADYERLDYAGAEARARDALAAYDRFTPAQLTDIHILLALVFYSRNDADEAARHFEAALSLTPDVQLDPLYVSPKILAFFDEIRQQRPAAGRAQDAAVPEVPEVRYLVVPDPRPSAAMRSMLLPGWGQLHKGERAKGWILAGAWTATLTASLGAHVRRTHAAEAYRAATDPAQIDARYATYDRWHRARNGLLVGAAAVWVFSYVDALVVRGDLPDDSFRMRTAVEPAAVRLSLEVPL